MDSNKKHVQNLIFLAVLVIILFGGYLKVEYFNLPSENKIIENIETAYNKKDYLLAKSNIKLLLKEHPKSPKNIEFKDLLTTIKKRELVIEEKKRANDTGIWKFFYYVDEFGDDTKKEYIGIRERIKGKFSNSATENSRLHASFLIDDSENIDIKLYEYAGKNPVKAYSNQTYWVYIKDKDGQRFKLKEGVMRGGSDRISLSKGDSKILHGVLIKGGAVKFYIFGGVGDRNNYTFKIEKDNGYGNAYRKLIATKNK